MDSARSTGGEGSIYLSGSLKHHLKMLENSIYKIQDDITFQKKEIQILKSEKEVLEQTLDQKSLDLRNSQEAEVSRWGSDLREKFQNAQSNNNSLQQEISTLKIEKTTLQQVMLEMKSRIWELEFIVGQQK